MWSIGSMRKNVIKFRRYGAREKGYAIGEDGYLALECLLRVSTVPMHVLICGVKCFLLAMLPNQLEISKYKRQKWAWLNLAIVGVDEEDWQDCYDWNLHLLWCGPMVCQACLELATCQWCGERIEGPTRNASARILILALQSWSAFVDYAVGGICHGGFNYCLTLLRGGQQSDGSSPLVFFCIRIKRIWSGNIWIEWVRFCPSSKVGWGKSWARPGCCCQAMCYLAAM